MTVPINPVNCCTRSRALRISAAIALSIFAAPVFADDCRTYVSQGGSKLEVKPEERGLVVDGTERCFIAGEAIGITPLRAHCGHGSSAFFSVASKPGGRYDLLIFADEVWYEDCPGSNSDAVPSAEASGTDLKDK
jgi:hypothetical protein